MRSSFTLAGATLLLSAAAHGQSIDAQKVTFDYVRLPLVPLPAGTHTYSPEVVLRYVDAVKQQKVDHEAAVAEAKIKAERDKQEYKAQSLKEKALNRLLLDQHKPGEAVIPTADYTAQVFDAPTLATTYVTLSGLQKAQGTSGDLRVTVSLDGFTQGPTTAVVTQNGIKVSPTATGANSKRSYEVSYKSPVAVKVTTKDGTVLSDELLEATTAYSTVTTDVFGGEEELNN